MILYGYTIVYHFKIACFYIYSYGLFLLSYLYCTIQDESDAMLDSDNEAPYIKKILTELENRTYKVFIDGTYKCPFDEKHRNGEKKSLIDHAKSTSIYGVTSGNRARHMALLTYMLVGEI